MQEIEKTLADFINICAASLGIAEEMLAEPTVEGVAAVESTAAMESGAVLPLAYLIAEDAEVYADTAHSAISAISACTACRLCETRTLVVPGEGVENPLVMIIGEGPGADEDRTGRPFVGRAGQLLDKMIASIGLSREKNCFIANVVKCRPPGNRNPSQDEIDACFPYLQKQIVMLQPKIILCAGKISAQRLFDSSLGINAIRGSFSEYDTGIDGSAAIPLLATYHPSAVLRDESLKRPAWEDLKLLRSKLEEMGLGIGLL